METTLEDLEFAASAVEGKTPEEVVEAFLPDTIKVGGFALVPLTAGHEMVWAKLGHPFGKRDAAAVIGRTMTPDEIALAIFTTTRTSDELFRLLAEDRFEAEFFAFMEAFPTGDLTQAAQAVTLHWMRACSSAVAMRSPHAAPLKKKAASAGCSRSSTAAAPSSAGRSTMSFIASLWRNFSRCWRWPAGRRA